MFSIIKVQAFGYVLTCANCLVDYCQIFLALKRDPEICQKFLDKYLSIDQCNDVRDCHFKFFASEYAPMTKISLKIHQDQELLPHTKRNGGGGH